MNDSTITNRLLLLIALMQFHVTARAVSAGATSMEQFTEILQPFEDELKALGTLLSAPQVPLDAPLQESIQRPEAV